MAYIVTLTGRDTVLASDFDPPIILDPNKSYSLALLSFESYHSIPNVTAQKNKFRFVTADGVQRTVTIPIGSYELDTLETSIQRRISPNIFRFEVIRATSKVEIYSNVSVVLGDTDDIGFLLGIHSKTTIPPNKSYQVEGIVNINPVNSIEISCNLVQQSYRNSEAVHVLYGFSPDVPPGFKLLEKINNLIYLPVNSRIIQNITCTITDQDGNPISFQEEVITLRLHLKEDGH